MWSAGFFWDDCKEYLQPAPVQTAQAEQIRSPARIWRNKQWIVKVSKIDFDFNSPSLLL